LRSYNSVNRERLGIGDRELATVSFGNEYVTVSRKYVGLAYSGSSFPCRHLVDDPGDHDIPLHDLPTPAARVPLHPLLFSLCYRGDPGIRTLAWELAGIEAHIAMSSFYEWRG